LKKTEILQSMDAEFLKDNKNNGAKESKWLQKHSVVLPRERQTVWFQGTSACSMLACGFARPLLDWEIFFGINYPCILTNLKIYKTAETIKKI